MNLVLLHGFWGQPSDWDLVLESLKKPLNDEQVFVPDLYKHPKLSPEYSFAQWSHNFLQTLNERFGDQELDLIGYSMGGRLALHALVTQAKRFRRTLLLSTRLNLGSLVKDERIQWTEKWSSRFKALDWTELSTLWEDQEVFVNSLPGRTRRTEDSLRTGLVQSLNAWSVLKHEFTLRQLEELPCEVDWFFGASDQKFHSVMKDLQTSRLKGQKKLIDRAGHRILWDRPDVVAQWIQGVK